jgi:hypothetical protein
MRTRSPRRMNRAAGGPLRNADCGFIGGFSEPTPQPVIPLHLSIDRVSWNIRNPQPR